MKTEKVKYDPPSEVSPDEKKWVEQERNNFLAMVTHDFKSPLTVMMGYTELIATHEGLDSNLSEMCAHILKNGEKLLGMVDDFTFHVKLQSGVLTPEFASTDLNAVLKEVKKEFSVQAAKKRQIIEMELAEGFPFAFLDRKLIERAIDNLLQNAINYTPEGGRISLKTEYHVIGNRSFPVMSVSDTGPGIPPEQISQLFDMYFRSQNTGGVRGAGLGLTIVKAVAEAHGGHVEVDSELGKGSTFYIHLPSVAVDMFREHSVTAAV
ncbi:MAG: HAMP domain-containing sensor histidine kinase [Nitrospirota bacterium]